MVILSLWENASINSFTSAFVVSKCSFALIGVLLHNKVLTEHAIKEMNKFWIFCILDGQPAVVILCWSSHKWFCNNVFFLSSHCKFSGRLCVPGQKSSFIIELILLLLMLLNVDAVAIEGSCFIHRCNAIPALLFDHSFSQKSISNHPGKDCNRKPLKPKIC